MATPGTRKAAATRYKKKLDKLFCNAPKDQKEAAALLTRRAAFLLAAEDELERTMEDDGFVSYYDNGGGQCGTTMSIALKSYATANQQLLATFKQLQNFLPVDDDQAEDALKLFIKAHK